MSQKFIKKVNSNPRSMAYGKCFARAIYDKNFVGTKETQKMLPNSTYSSSGV